MFGVQWWPAAEDIDWSEVVAFASIPVVASLIGYGTNVLAIQMTFLPLEYIGYYEPAFRRCGFSLGWQGIIPANAEKIAEKAVSIMTKRLLSIDEVFSRLEAERIAHLLREPLIKALERVIESVAVSHAHDVWESLPLLARHELVHKASEIAEPLVCELVTELRASIHDVLDLHGLAVEVLLEDKALMNEVFKRCGDAEFRFIERSGFYFGFLLGILQAALWWLLLELQASLAEPSALPLWWFLPAAGALCGYVTNALALHVIFNPVEPTRCCCCFTLQGLFLQRQAEVSREFATIVGARVVTAANCWGNILHGPRGREVLRQMVTRHVTRAIDSQVGLLRPLVPILVGSSNFHAAKLRAAELMLDELPGCLRATYEYTEDAMGIAALLEERMARLPPSEFERVLHPAFEEDEWKLILVGGLLGLAVGCFQLIFVFHDAI
jgi:uncharacterized membrane protein YheB (UPF0754 family)